MHYVKRRAVEERSKPSNFCANISSSITYSKKCFDAGFKASKNAPGKVLTVVYEQLDVNPQREAKKICNFLGMEWNDLMMYPGDKEHLGEQAVTSKSKEIWYDSDTYYRNPDSGNIGKWRNKLLFGQQFKTTIAFKGNEELIRYGYDLSVNSLAQGRRVLFRSYFYFLCFSRTIYRFLSFDVRKIPDISFIRSGLLTIAKFLG